MKIFNFKKYKMTEEQYEQAKFIKERIEAFENYKKRIEKVYNSIEREELDLSELKDLLSKCNDIANYCISLEKINFEKL